MPNSDEAGARLRWWCRAVDPAIAAALFAAGVVLALSFLTNVRTNPFGDLLGPTVMAGCGLGLTKPAVENNPYLAFYVRQSDVLQCDELAEGARTAATGLASYSRVSIYTTAAVLRIGGVSWRTLDLFLACVFGLAMSLAYTLFRVVLRWPLALLGALILMFSDHVTQLGDYRDFSKQPLFYAAWLAAAWAVLRRSEHGRRSAMLPALAGGVVIGVGMGFRVDLLVCVPVFVAMIMCGPGSTRPELLLKARDTGAFLLAFALAGLPTLRTMATVGDEGSNSGHVILLGMTTGFTDMLRLERPVYDIGDLYADVFALSLIEAHAAFVQNDPVLAPIGSARYDRHGAAVVRDIAYRFPADMLIRAIAATAQVLRHPFGAGARRQHQNVPALTTIDIFQGAARWRDRLLAPFDGYVLTVIFILLLGLATASWRVAAAATILVLYFCGYSMLQFSRRHTFHLDIIPVGLLLVTVQWVWVATVRVIGDWRAAADAAALAVRRGIAPGVGTLAMLATAIYAALFLARQWQQRHVTELVDATLAVAWEPIAVAREPLSQSTLVDGLAVPTWRGLYAAAPDRWNDAVLFRFVHARPPAAAGSLGVQYLNLELQHAACGAAIVPIALKYAGQVPTYDWEYTRVLEVPLEEQGPSHVLIPTFEWQGRSRFEGVAVPAALARCLTAVRRAASPSAVQFPLLVASLPAGWRQTPLYQRMMPAPVATR